MEVDQTFRSGSRGHRACITYAPAAPMPTATHLPSAAADALHPGGLMRWTPSGVRNCLAARVCPRAQRPFTTLLLLPTPTASSPRASGTVRYGVRIRRLVRIVQEDVRFSVPGPSDTCDIPGAYPDEPVLSVHMTSIPHYAIGSEMAQPACVPAAAVGVRDPAARMLPVAGGGPSGGPEQRGRRRASIGPVRSTGLRPRAAHRCVAAGAPAVAPAFEGSPSSCDRRRA